MSAGDFWVLTAMHGEEQSVNAEVGHTSIELCDSRLKKMLVEGKGGLSRVGRMGLGFYILWFGVLLGWIWSLRGPFGGLGEKPP